jgi:hypothetical protein
MRRSVLALDRIAAVVLGLALFAAGIAAAGWYTGALRRLWPAFRKRLSTAGFTRSPGLHADARCTAEYGPGRSGDGRGAGKGLADGSSLRCQP